MPRKKAANTDQPAPDVPPIPTRGKEVVYTIVVSRCDDKVKIEAARRNLRERGIKESLIHIDAERGVVSVPRLFTLWQGDDQEQAWQRSIQNAIPNCLIDVADWRPAPGYPIGEIGEAHEQAC